MSQACKVFLKLMGMNKTITTLIGQGHWRKIGLCCSIIHSSLIRISGGQQASASTSTSSKTSGMNNWKKNHARKYCQTSTLKLHSIIQQGRVRLTSWKTIWALYTKRLIWFSNIIMNVIEKIYREKELYVISQPLNRHH